MLKLNEVEKWFGDLENIIFDINVSIDNIKRITHPDDEFEKQILKHGFFSHYYRQSRFTIIVQLCKLFDENKNQKRNLFKLFNRLSLDEYDEKLMERLNSNSNSNRFFVNRSDIQTEIFLLKAEIETHKEIIKKVISLRDKFCAHSDPSSVLPRVDNPELEALVKLSVKIYNKIRSNMFDTTFLFDHNADWKVDYPIKMLAFYKKEQTETLRLKSINK
jgi:hypothetical protein